MSEMYKMVVNDFILEKTSPEKHPKSEKIGLRWRIGPLSVSPKILQLEH